VIDQDGLGIEGGGKWNDGAIRLGGPRQHLVGKTGLEPDTQGNVVQRFATWIGNRAFKVHSQSYGNIKDVGVGVGIIADVVSVQIVRQCVNRIQQAQKLERLDGGYGVKAVGRIVGECGGSACWRGNEFEMA